MLEDEAQWEGVIVSGAVGGPPEVAEVEIIASHLRGARLTGRHFDQLRLVDVLLEDCELSAVTLERSVLQRVELRRCRLSGLVAPGARAAHVRVTDCKLDGASFRMSVWERSAFESCDLGRADFCEARLPGVRLFDCNLAGLDCTRARLTGGALHGSTLEGITGAESLRGVVIGTDQILPLAFPVFAALGITVNDERPGT